MLFKTSELPVSDISGIAPSSVPLGSGGPIKPGGTHLLIRSRLAVLLKNITFREYIP